MKKWKVTEPKGTKRDSPRVAAKKVHHPDDAVDWRELELFDRRQIEMVTERHTTNEDRNRDDQ